MNKRGEAVLEAINWMWRLVPVIVIAIFLVAVAFSYLSEDFQTDSLEETVLSKALRFSPNCLASVDDLGNVRPGVIDLSKFESFKLGACYSKPSLYYKVALLSSEDEIVASADVIPVNVEKIIPVCATIPEYKCSSREDYVLYSDGETLVPGTLRVEVVRRVE